MISKLILGITFLFVASVGFASDVTDDHADNVPNPTHEESAHGNLGHGSWHCTAYPEGHGHQHGYSYSDEHYSHARSGAIRACEYSTGHHCHDVHCHFDHHHSNATPADNATQK